MSRDRRGSIRAHTSSPWFVNQIPTVGGNIRAGCRLPAMSGTRRRGSRQRKGGDGPSEGGEIHDAGTVVTVVRGASSSRTDVGGPALAGVLVEEGDGWGGGIHGGCVSRVRSHCRARGGLETAKVTLRPFVSRTDGKCPNARS